MNHERWLVSYADFITLLFAFFVVMFAVSQVDGQKVGRFTESFNQAVGCRHSVAPSVQGVLPGPGTSSLRRPRGKRRGDAGRVAGPREETERPGHRRSPRGYQDRPAAQRDRPAHARGPSVPERRRYPKGACRRALRAIADKIRDIHVDVRVEGHTDNVPIHTVALSFQLGLCRRHAPRR